MQLTFGYHLRHEHWWTL